MPTHLPWRSLAGSWLVVGVPVWSAGGAQQVPEALEPATELEALIARTNALGSLRAKYRGEEPAGPVELELAYQAPDRAVLSVRRPEGDWTWWFVRGVSVTRFSEERWWRVESPEPPPSFLEMLALTGGEPLAPGVVLRLSAPGAPPPGGASLLLDYRPEGREALFAWLPELRAALPEEVRCEGETLLWTDSARALSLSRASGLPTTIALSRAPSSAPPLALALVAFDSDVELDPALFRWPAAGDAAERDRAQEARVREERYGPVATRILAHERLGAALGTGGREWDERTQAAWEHFLGTLFTEWKGPGWRERKAELRAEVDELSEWSRDADPDTARETITARRTARARALDAEVEATLAALPPLANPDPRLLARERPVVTRLVDELLRQPALAYFDDHLSRPIPRPGDRR